MLSPNQSRNRKFTAFDATDLDELSLRKAHAEVGETTESRTKGLLELKERLLKVKDLSPCLDDNFLLGFLRVGKFDVCKTFDRIHKYYCQHDKLPEEFRNASPGALRKIKELEFYWTSPYRTKDNAAILINKHNLFHPSRIYFEEKFYGEFLGCNLLIRNPITQMCGIVTLQDYSDLTLEKFRAHTLGRMRKYVDLLEGSYPCRWREVHVITDSIFCKIIYNLVYPFLSKKIKKRIFIHPKNDNWKSLHAAIPPEILPEEYGGHVKQSEMIHLLENVQELDEDFHNQLIYGFNKSHHNK